MVNSVQRAKRTIPKEYRIRCSGCGKDVDMRWSYCVKCGKKIQSSGTTQPPCLNTVIEPQSGQ